MRHNLYRYLLTAAIWSLILFFAVTSLRASNAATALYEKAVGGATRADVLAYQRAAEFAKAFAAEWATFSGDGNEYAARLRAFNPALRFNPPSGCAQRAVSASVLSLERKGGGYEALVSLRVQRFVELPDANALPEAYRQPVQAVGAAAKPKGWVDTQMAVRVAVFEKNGRLFAPNTPVLAPGAAAPEVETRIDYAANPSPAVAAALTGFMKAYFAGKDPAELANFAAPGSGITPVGGWEVRSVDSVVVDDANAPARASVWVTAAQGGFATQQHLYLDLVSKSGQVFVAAVKAEPN